MSVVIFSKIWKLANSCWRENDNDVADLGVLALPTVDKKLIFCVVERKSVVTYTFRRAYSLILCHVSNTIYWSCTVLSNDL